MPRRSTRALPRMARVVGRLAGVGALLAALSCHPEDRPKAPPTSGADTPRRMPPRLLVLVVVDQMPARIVERDRARWRDGLARIFSQGASTLEGWHRHAGTFTAAGHGTLATGTDPAHHGLVANHWWDREHWRSVDAVADPDAAPVGAPDAGPRSAVHLLRPGLADWWEAADPRAHTVSLGLKDRAVIALGGQHPDLAVWLDRDAGRWVTSTWYADTLPAFVSAVDVARRARALLGEAWDVARGGADDPVPDRVEAEADGVHVTFPHRTADLLRWDETVEAAIRATPFGNTLVADLAVAVIAEGPLGRDDVPDLLCVAFSSTDYVGHRFGPDSREIVDTYDRLDADLGRLLDALDAHVGRDRYVLVLASDHGVTPLPERAGGRRIRPDELVAQVRRALEAGFAPAGAFEGIPRPKVAYEDGVYFGFSANTPPAVRARVRAAAAAALRARPDVADVFTSDELAAAEPPSRPFGAAFARSFHPARSPDLLVRPARGSLVIDYPGTTHGTPYPWDRQVPIAVLDPTVPPGRAGGRFETVDLAPSLAARFAVPVPAGVDGHPRPLDLAPP